jgi:diaminopimelate epimerase
MLKNFLKYQSLGNDFILFDWYKKPETYINNVLSEANFPLMVQQMCERRLGVGADGVLVLKGCTSTSMPEMLIFNSDGSKAEMCMNGLRCVAHQLYAAYNFPTQFKLKVGQRIVECFIFKPSDFLDQTLIRTNVGLVDYLGEKSITTSQGSFSGHVVSVGNPHFILFQKTTLDWLEKNGSEIEKHEAFENKTNVEFVWQEEPLFFRSLVYERGCGITLACSSGAAAISGTLLKLGMIKSDCEFKIAMPGGVIECMVSPQGNVSLSAEAKFVFSGVYGK